MGAGDRHKTDPTNHRMPLRLPSAGWAWECLRRNPDYVRDFRRNRAGLDRPIVLKSATRLIRQRRRFPDAEKWGLLTFADPKASAPEADVFWTSDALPSAIDVQLTGVLDHEIERADQGDLIFLRRLQTRRSILETSWGPQHILLDGMRFWVQLNSRASDMIGDCGAVSLKIEGFAHANLKLKTGAHFLELYRRIDGRLSAIATRRDAKKIRKALIAYDVRAAGGGYKDIAIALFGYETVKEEWVCGRRHLKDRAKRALAPAEELIDGGYRRLLLN